MASRRDQLQSYQFLLQRVISALVMRETDPAQAPLRRGTGAVFAGVMIAVLLAVGFGVVGLLAKVGSGSWQTDGAVVVEKETGAPYLYRMGALHPMLNYTSALLASAKQPPTVFRVPAASLRDVPRGIMRGIVGAPTSLPERRGLIGAPWTLCSAPGQDDANQAITTTSLVLGRAVTGGRPVGENGAMLVRDAKAKTTYLVWHSFRYQILTKEAVLALFGEVTPVDVGAAWINGLAAGPDIGPITVDRKGERSAAVPSRKNGNLLVARTGTGTQYYLVLDDGLAVISELQKDLAVGTGAISGSPDGETITVADATAAKQSGKLARPAAGDAALPPQTPKPLITPAATERVCAQSGDPKAAPAITVGGAFADLGPGTPTGSASPQGASLADRVVVPAGRGALVRALGSPSATTGAYSVVTDFGVRYPVSDAVLGMLGYAPGDAVPMPASLVNRIPAGPALDPVDALTPVARNQPGGS
ncbi:type VII secretion protein EccB [Longispora fulva]|uniref:Type VII secretion protein EccB n=1 Tax=Longispora fulva TaxID=619741 RepID=A0A8J7GX26_9ACTN|nr:type VII secretion protein EccB [Longispora fulva]MBG6140579.1 type VII secretion protein EccB [Longispora fulva]GIG57039.1 type VII secretion protein EccB [Longispora fulva]